jgi:hypothetical protein
LIITSVEKEADQPGSTDLTVEKENQTLELAVHSVAEKKARTHSLIHLKLTN